ncbi:hypothetical protein [Aestuariivirga sp.]|uniref:hypothetical protein n=1 Tax=Aestuariivirga sp. TaxID=2650926 RepID=UPI0039E436BB
MFEQVKEKAGLAGWPATIAAHDNDFGDYEGTNLIRPVFESGAAGTFSVDETKTVIITYSAKLLKDPHGLVATFAHELSHYLLFSSKSKWPVPQEEMEFLTDLTAVFLGFGIFLCNTRFRYQQFSDGISAGWSWNRQGYLPESDLLFASACFLKARQLGSGEAEKYLKSGLIKDFRRAIDQAAEAAFQHQRPEP